MICFTNLAKYLMAAAVLSCLTVSNLPGETQVLQAKNDADDATSHRGSGRIVTQVPTRSLSTPMTSYRGTGRLHHPEEPAIAHRGSGRIDQQNPDTQDTAYRGSGRVKPDPHQLARWA